VAAQPWFKCLSPNHPAMVPVIDALGYEGYGYMCALLDEHHRLGELEITTRFLCQFLKINTQKAARILPKVLESFEKALESFEKFQKVSKSSEKSQKVQTFEASNPHGSTRDQEENRLEEREENRLKGPQEKTTAAKNKRGVRLPPDWQPSDVLADWAKTTRPDLVIAESVDRFRDYWIAKPGEAGVKLDWDATFRNWIRNERGQNLGQTQSRASHERLHGSDIVPAEQRQGGILTLWQ